MSEDKKKSGLLACSDFFFTTRICDTAKEIGRTFEVCSGSEEICRKLETDSCSLLIIDLATMSQVLEELSNFRERSSSLSIIAFGSHVEVSLLKKAREAGCDLVLPRSKFTQELVNLLETYC